jgi:hypothetical protein
LVHFREKLIQTCLVTHYGWVWSARFHLFNHCSGSLAGEKWARDPVHSNLSGIKGFNDVFSHSAFLLIQQIPFFTTKIVAIKFLKLQMLKMFTLSRTDPSTGQIRNTFRCCCGQHATGGDSGGCCGDSAMSRKSATLAVSGRISERKNLSESTQFLRILEISPVFFLSASRLSENREKES